MDEEAELEARRSPHTAEVLTVFNPNGDAKIEPEEMIGALGDLARYTAFMLRAGANKPNDFRAKPGTHFAQVLAGGANSLCGEYSVSATPPEAHEVIARIQSVFTRTNISPAFQVEYPAAEVLQPHINRWHQNLVKACSI